MGACCVIFLFISFVLRAVYIAKNAVTLFGSLVALGIAGHVGVQAFLNIGVVTGTIPNTGVTLPFVSYGGTAQVTLLIAYGLILSVSRSGTLSLERKKRQAEKRLLKRGA